MKQILFFSTKHSSALRAGFKATNQYKMIFLTFQEVFLNLDLVTWGNVRLLRNCKFFAFKMAYPLSRYQLYDAKILENST